MKLFIATTFGFLLCALIVVTIYFTLINKKMCKGEFVDCPSGNISICAKKGTDAGKFCPKMNDSFSKQNNRSYISQYMSQVCGNDISTKSDAVKCALDLSIFENEKMGYPIFGNSTGIGSDVAQSRWCLGKEPGLSNNYPNEINKRASPSSCGNSIKKNTDNKTPTDNCNCP